MCFGFYWVYKLILFISGKIDELKPTKINQKTSPITTFLICEVVYKGYLYSFYVLYLTFKKLIIKDSNSKTEFFCNFIINFMIKLITGFSKRIIRNSYIWSLKASQIDIFKEFDIFLYNIVIDIFEDLITIENHRIFKTNGKFDFNVKIEEIIAKLSKITVTKDLIQQAHLILINSPIEESLLAFKNVSVYKNIYLPGSKISHATTIYSPLKGDGIKIGTNITSKPQIYLKKPLNEIEESKTSIIMKDDSFIHITRPYIINSKDILNKSISWKSNDNRQLAENLSFNRVHNFFNLFLFEEDSILYLNEQGLIKQPLLKNTTLFNSLKNKLINFNDNNYELKHEFQKSFEEINNFQLESFSNLPLELQGCIMFASLEKHSPESFMFFKKIFIKYQKNPTIILQKSNIDDEIL